MVTMHATNCVLYLLYRNQNDKKFVFVLKRYPVRNAKIRPYAVRITHLTKIWQYAYGKFALSSTCILVGELNADIFLRGNINVWI